MANATMPPTEPMDASSPMGGAMPSAKPSPETGATMLSVPAEAFDALHSLVAELLKTLDSLKSEGAGASGGMPPKMGAMPPGEGMPPMGGGMGGNDEDFLSAMAAEGSNRSR